MTYDEDYGTVHSGDFDLEKNKYYRIYCTNYTSEPSWDYFAFGKSGQMTFPVKAQVIKVLRWGESVNFYVTSTNEEWYLETYFGYNIEIYLKATIEVKSVCASIVPED